MIYNVIKQRSRNAISRGTTSQRLALNRRHYLGGTGNYTLFQGGASTA